MKTPIGFIAGIAFAAGASMITGKNAAAETPAEFYNDNVITAILGAGPGGGYDLYARTVMSHLV
jgi:tripartite-type tricarboxylate transporter receptor subunit TctC